MIYKDKDIKRWIKFNLGRLEIDITGQINFIDTGFQDDQEMRIKIQRVFDNFFWDEN